MRSFSSWLSTFRDSISDYTYYIDFSKVHRNVATIRTELSILNSLIGAENIEEEFVELTRKYPETLKCVPLLLAVRSTEIYAQDEEGGYLYNFTRPNQTAEQYQLFMRKTGLFDLIERRIINNLIDYVTGVETGLDSNGRKNRGGHLMENLVETYLRKAGLKQYIHYFKEMATNEIETKWGLDLSAISDNGKNIKRFDFVARVKSTVYAIETNFYTGGGSKLNETSRSYKNIALGTKGINNFKFVWITDGKGWFAAKHNLEETFNAMEHIYNISDLEKGIVQEVIR